MAAILLGAGADLPAQTPAPSGAASFYHLGIEARRQSDPVTAAAWLEQAVTLDPTAVLPRLEWAGVLLQLGRPRDVPVALSGLEDRIHEIAAAHPQDAALYYRLRAAALSRSGDPAAAVELYEKAVLYDPADLGLRAQLIGLHRARGAPEAALVHLRAAVEMRPGSLDLRLEVGRAFLELARWREAERAFRTALEIQHGHEEAWDGLGLALAGQRRYGAAEEAFRAGLRVAPASASLYEHLGDALVEDGRIADALNAYERAATLSPGSAGALRAKIDRAKSTSPQ